MSFRRKPESIFTSFAFRQASRASVGNETPSLIHPHPQMDSGFRRNDGVVLRFRMMREGVGAAYMRPCLSPTNSGRIICDPYNGHAPFDTNAPFSVAFYLRRLLRMRKMGGGACPERSRGAATQGEGGGVFQQPPQEASKKTPGKKPSPEYIFPHKKRGAPLGTPPFRFSLAMRYAASRACSRSAMMSSMCSMPMESRT